MLAIASYLPHGHVRGINLLILMLSRKWISIFLKMFNFSFKQVSFVTCILFMSVFAGSISENEDPPPSLLRLHGNWIKCETSVPPLYHCRYCSLSANHYILVNLSLDQVTVRHLKTWSPSVLDLKKCGCWVFVHLPLYDLCLE